MTKPTKEDAALIVQIMAASNADELYQKAQWWFYFEFNEKTYEDFQKKYPPGSDGYKFFMKFATEAEYVTTLVNRELLSDELVFDLVGDLLWNKAEPVVHGLRKDFGMPRLFENYEFCAKKYPEWAEKNPPKV
jgi:hypothetical protein